MDVGIRLPQRDTSSYERTSSNKNTIPIPRKLHSQESCSGHSVPNSPSRTQELSVIDAYIEPLHNVEEHACILHVAWNSTARRRTNYF